MPGEELSYDGAGRLVRVRTGSATGPIQAEYGYDANGNRRSVVRGGVTTNSTYDAQDRIVASGAATFAHSADGDRTKRTQGAAVTNYTFGFFGNLRSVVTGARRVDYLSDGSGLRAVRKFNGVVTQRWIYDSGGRIVGETDATGTLTKRFVYASQSHSPDQMLKTDGTYALIKDHLGSIRVVVNTATGAVAQRMDYDEFGRITKDTASGFQPFGFVGGLYDPETKLTLFIARSYDSETGRWLSRDPILFAGCDSNLFSYTGTVGKPPLPILPNLAGISVQDGGIPRKIETNLYGYTWSDPINFIDPDGLEAFAGNDSAVLPICVKLRNCKSVIDAGKLLPPGIPGGAFIKGCLKGLGAACEPKQKERGG